jgi:hypothetical protein
MMDAGPERLLRRAEAYFRTAVAAVKEGDPDPAYENFRTAAELAAKALLQHLEVPYPRSHNIGGTLAQAGCWPKGEQGRRMSVFLASSTRAVYGFTQDVDPLAVQEAHRLADQMITIARARLRGSD